MSLGSILLGLINIAIVVVVLLLIGACILWFLSWLSFPGARHGAKAVHRRGSTDRPVHAGGIAAGHPHGADYRGQVSGPCARVPTFPPARYGNGFSKWFRQRWTLPSGSGPSSAVDSSGLAATPSPALSRYFAFCPQPDHSRLPLTGRARVRADKLDRATSLKSASIFICDALQRRCQPLDFLRASFLKRPRGPAFPSPWRSRSISSAASFSSGRRGSHFFCRSRSMISLMASATSSCRPTSSPSCHRADRWRSRYLSCRC